MEETWRSYNREEHRISNTVPTSRYDLRLEFELREIEWNCAELSGIAWNWPEFKRIGNPTSARFMKGYLHFSL